MSLCQRNQDKILFLLTSITLKMPKSIFNIFSNFLTIKIFLGLKIDIFTKTKLLIHKIWRML